MLSNESSQNKQSLIEKFSVKSKKSLVWILAATGLLTWFVEKAKAITAYRTEPCAYEKNLEILNHRNRDSKMYFYCVLWKLFISWGNGIAPVLNNNWWQVKCRCRFRDGDLEIYE